MTCVLVPTEVQTSTSQETEDGEEEEEREEAYTTCIACRQIKTSRSQTGMILYSFSLLDK